MCDRSDIVTCGFNNMLIDLINTLINRRYNKFNLNISRYCGFSNCNTANKMLIKGLLVNGNREFKINFL